MCEAAKKLTEKEKKSIWDFIYANSDAKKIGGEEAKKWTQKWYDKCLDKEDALETMQQFIEDGFDEELGSSPSLIQFIVIYAGEM